MAPSLPPLPVDALLPRAVELLRAGRNLVLSADPGAGKTTRLPRALLDAGLLEAGSCWVLEPRRLAARLAACRVAEELGEAVGERVGYAVRFERRAGPATRIHFVTEALLLRRLQENPCLDGIAVAVLDEFHERSLHTDLALALLRRLQRERRPDLRIVAMSATLDAGPLSAYLDAEHLHSGGRLHPVELRHAERPDARPLEQQVASSLEPLDPGRGHALVFLPGAAEIRACARACETPAARLGYALRLLHGSLPLEAQREAVAPSAQPKLILSTNVAESSLTIDGVAAVVDSGLAREAAHDPWSGLSGLSTRRISQARCIQRAGRAGRTGPGLCLRLYTSGDFHARPAFDAPELQRADLAEALLVLHGMGQDPRRLAWFEAPPEAALEAAEGLLARLGALGTDGGLSAAGRAMARLPLHPRLARLVQAAEQLGVGHLGRLAAALLEGGSIEARRGLDAEFRAGGHALDSDLFARLDAFREAEAHGFQAQALRAAGLDPAAAHQAREAWRALGGRRAEEGAEAEERLLRALLAAYPDRLARAGGKGTYALLGGGGARLAPESRVRAELILALEAERSGREVRIRTASKVEPEWLLEAFPEALREEEELRFNPESGRVERVLRLLLGDLSIEETRRRADPGDPRAAALLAEAMAERGLGDAGEALLDRLAFLARLHPELELPPRELLKGNLLAQACEGLDGLKDLARADWRGILQAALPEAAALLERLAPGEVQLPRRRVKVRYDGEEPWIESRLQDFLGLRTGPSVGGRPLVLHLLAPNGRAVQVTRDLAGFWARAYRELRPQLSRRYPRHAWPEDPLQSLKT